ncbi:MAG: MMPL family transporter [Planctomycetales bacterium]|nr:MMPL family transporter [Planctomycetales bacterium]
MISNPRTRRLLEWMIHRRGWLFASGLILSIAAAWFGRQLSLDRSIENMFAEDDPVRTTYLELQRVFGQHDIILAVYSDPELSSPAGLERLGNLAAKIRKVAGVVATVSLLDPPQAANFEDAQRGALLREVFVGYTHNRQLDVAGIVCLLERPTDGNASRRETLRELRLILSLYDNGTIVGEPVVVEEAFDLLEADGQRLNTWCTLLLMLTITICFRSVRWLVLPLVVVQMTLALTRGLLVLLGLQLSIVSSMLAAIVTVVGVATVVHVIVRYRDAQSRDLAPVQALLEAGRVLVVPVFFACLTDAAGFAALMISHVGPVYDFGLMMALGSLMVLVSVVLAVPYLVLAGSNSAGRTKVANEQTLQLSLQRMLDWSTQHSRSLLLASAALVAVIAAGSPRLVLETQFTRNFRQNSELIEGYRFVEEHFEGAGVWDIFITAPKRLDKDFALDLLEFEARLLAEVPNLSKAISIADILDAGCGGLRQLDLGAELAVRGGLALVRGRIPEFVAAVYSEGDRQTKPKVRILLRAPEQLDTAEKMQMIEHVRTLAVEELPGAQVTGYYVLLAQLVESLLRDQWTTFCVAAAAISAMMFLAFRSLRLALVTLVPNALPVLVLFGAMGWLGVRVNMGAAMIAAVSLGLSVDGSIHYVLSYQRERREGASLATALRSVQATVGRASVFATLALVIGFATLCFSDFVPTIYFGTLVSLSMIGGLVGNLVILPLLIQWVDR